MIETTGNRMMTTRTTDKPFNITKKQVYEAYKGVKSNQGAAGVDKETIEQFEANLKGNLYKLWRARYATFRRRCVPSPTLGGLVGEAMPKPDVVSVDVIRLCKAFEQRFEIRVFLFCTARMPQIADVRNLAAGLCPSDARQRNQGAADERQDIAPSHVGHGLAPLK